jgi:hypothetical protein
MKFSKVPNPYPKGQSFIYFPVEGQTNYRSVTVVTPFVADDKGEPTAELDVENKFYFFEFFIGNEVMQKVPIQHIGKKPNAIGQKLIAVEKIVPVKEYLSAPIKNPTAVALIELWLDANSI